MLNINLLEKLCNSYGISGREENVRDVIMNELSSFVDDLSIDNLGNLIAFKRGKERPIKRLMLSAHMDEVGFIITHVTNEGLLKFSAVGGIDDKVICGKDVVVGEKQIPGVIGVKPIHLLNKDEREQKVSIQDLYIDIGAKDKEEALNYISLGDSACFEKNFIYEGNMVKSKALDDRAGCFILTNLIKRDLPFDTYFTFVVQEEVGLRGAKVAAYSVNPDSAIVIESTTASDIRGNDEEKRVGNGAVISFMDKRTIYDKDYYKLALKLADENNIKLQIKEAVAGGNDSGTIHTSRSGVKTIAISLPCRYLHSAVGMISINDLFSVEELALKFIENLGNC